MSTLSFSDNSLGNSGDLLTTLAGKPTARQRGGIVPWTTECAPITAPSPILVLGSTKTPQAKETLLPISIGSKSTAYPSNLLRKELWPNIRQCPPMPESSPITIERAGLIKDICMIWQLRPSTNRESGNWRPPTNTCSLILLPSPMSMYGVSRKVVDPIWTWAPNRMSLPRTTVRNPIDV